MQKELKLVKLHQCTIFLRMYTGCDEYDWVKNRKIDKYYGKTTRCKALLSGSSCLVNEDLLKRDDFNKSTVEVKMLPITKIDLNLASLDYREKTLSKNNQWETIRSVLEDSKVSVVYKYNRRFNNYEVKYELPAVGYVSATEGDGARAVTSHGHIQRWLSWKGGYYDPDKLHILVSHDGTNVNKLKPLCDAKQTNPSFQNDPMIVSIPMHVKAMSNSSKRSSLYVIPSAAHPLYRTRNITSVKPSTTPLPITPANCHENTIIIDTRYTHLVTHIGIEGSSPLSVSFPEAFFRLASDSPGFVRDVLPGGIDLNNDGDAMGYITGKYNAKRGRSRVLRPSGQVNVMLQKTEHIPHLRVFELHYKTSSTAGWVKMSKTITISTVNYGITEHVIDLRPYSSSGEGIFTRFLKLVPLSWHIEPVYRVRLYGKRPLCGGVNGGFKKEGKPVQGSNNNDSSIPVTPPTPPVTSTFNGESVHYTLTTSQHDNWMQDGVMRSSYYWRYYIEQSRKKFAKYLKDTIREDSSD